VTPYLSDPDVTLHCGDALEVLRELPSGSVHMACTSPPFFGLRDYGTGAWEGGDEECDHIKQVPVQQDSTSTLGYPADGGARRIGDQNSTIVGKVVYHEVCGKCGARRIDSQIGLESSPDEWAARLADVFREVRRVLRDDGTLWVECGDSYSSGTNADRKPTQTASHGRWEADLEKRVDVVGVKPKDLIGQPWLLAFALRADGWFLRSCIIWAKPNCMPESTKDRPTTAHSYVFMFSKKPRYFWDQEALREPAEWARWGDQTVPKHEGTETASGWIPEKTKEQLRHLNQAPDRKQLDGGFGVKSMGGRADPADGGKNARTVWTIPTEPNALAICRLCDAYWQGGAPREHCGQPVVQHFAAFPRELVRRMILAGTSERGVCPKCFAPWIREVEQTPISTPTYSEPRGYTISGAKDTITRLGDGVRTKTLGWKPTCECEGGDARDRMASTDQEPTTGLRVTGRGLVSTLAPATVLDPFSGSGTTLLVARQLGRHAIGVELNERYCAMSRARLAQLSLLSEVGA
jgi:DNA modification methylase